jgi:ABC-type sulfate transport system substrate-binding protein
MKRVLVPTDFNVESTKIIDAIALHQGLQEVTVIFLHAFKLSDSITDMLMLSRRSKDYEHVSDEFNNKIDAYTAKYQNKVKGIGIEFFYGSTTAAFKNLLEGLQVDLVVYPQNYSFTPINKYSIDPKYLTSRCGCEVLELDIDVIANDKELFETKMQLEAANKAMTA